MSFFGRQGIPEELVACEYEEDGTDTNFEEDIYVLRNYYLVVVGVERDVFEMHRLVSPPRYHLPLDKRPPWLRSWTLQGPFLPH